MKKINALLIISFVLFISVNAFAQTTKTGTTSAQILKLNVGPRAIGMGGAFTAIADDITAIYWNPGGTANINTNEAFFNHTSLFADIQHDFAAFATNLSGIGTIGAFISVLSMDDMKVRTIEYPEGTGELFNYNTVVMGLNYSRYLTTNFAIGFNVKYISENLWHMNSAGFAIDIGTLYKIPVFNELRIASSISNFGTKLQLSGRDAMVIYPSGAGNENLVNSNIELDKFDLPLIFRFGISADVIKSGSSRLTVDIDAIHPNDNSEYLNAGFEYAWNEIIHLRAGYNSLFEVDSEKGLTLGFGLNYRIFEMVKAKIDYAYQDFGRLKSVHYFSIGIVF
ncbi:MAG: PorV/PorQ family protein [Melioribacteraceae bacterium]|nr:PorV/PorQ family protein [Melioribacteraceae bacterium]